MKKRILAAAFAAAAALTLSATPVFAHGPGAGPDWGPRPPMHRPAPPPPHRHHGEWFWGPLAAGATLWGISALIDNSYGYTGYGYAGSAARSAELSAQRAESAAIAAQAAANSANSTKTIYWCEAEQGFFPQVRACPTGWTPVLAP